MKILLITEQREGKWNKVSFETLAAAQQIAQQTSATLAGAVMGKASRPSRRNSRDRNSMKSCLIEHELLENYTPDAYTIALRQVVESCKARSDSAAAYIPGT